MLRAWSLPLAPWWQDYHPAVYRLSVFSGTCHAGDNHRKESSGVMSLEYRPLALFSSNLLNVKKTRWGSKPTSSPQHQRHLATTVLEASCWQVVLGMLSKWLGDVVSSREKRCCLHLLRVLRPVPPAARVACGYPHTQLALAMPGTCLIV